MRRHKPGHDGAVVEPPMSPDLLFWLSLALKMAVTAGFVIAAAMVAERAGAASARIVATLPVAAGPAYVFVALDHDVAFISASAIGSIAAHAATAVFSLVYIVLAQRAGMAVSVGGAVAVWFVGRVPAALGAMDVPRPWPPSISCCSASASRSPIAIATCRCRRSCASGTTSRCAPSWWRAWSPPWWDSAATSGRP